jgi:hypothetical protein
MFEPYKPASNLSDSLISCFYNTISVVAEANSLVHYTSTKIAHVQKFNVILAEQWLLYYLEIKQAYSSLPTDEPLPVFTFTYFKSNNVFSKYQERFFSLIYMYL